MNDTNIGITAAQYHAGLDKLWEALELTDVQDEDVFTLAAREIKRLKRGDDFVLRIAKPLSAETYESIAELLDNMRYISNGHHLMEIAETIAEMIYPERMDAEPPPPERNQ